MAHIIEPDHRAHAARGPGLSYQLGAKLLGQPLAMRMAAANRLKAAIENREFDAGVQVSLPGLSKFAGTIDARSRFRVTDDGIAIVPVGGLLIDRGGWLGDLGGFATSYEGIEEQIRRIEKDSAIKTVVLDIDSPGGMVAGIFDVCGLFAKLKKGRKLYALAANMADSAAYAIACVAHEVHVTRTGEVGSIGVIQYHQSYARALDAAGVDTTIIFEGERKPDGNPFQQLSHGARADMAADSADIYQQFVRHVAKHRGLEEDRVKATQARTYRGSKAVEAGLADKVSSFDELLDHIRNGGAARGKSKPGGRTVSDDASPAAARPDIEAALTAALNSIAASRAPAQPAAAAPAPAPAAAPVAAPAAVSGTSERDRIKAILAAPAAKGFAALAEHLAFETAHDAPTCVAILEAAAKDKPAAPAGDAAAVGSALERRMADPKNSGGIKPEAARADGLTGAAALPPLKDVFASRHQKKKGR